MTCSLLCMLRRAAPRCTCAAGGVLTSVALVSIPPFLNPGATEMEAAPTPLPIGKGASNRARSALGY